MKTYLNIYIGLSFILFGISQATAQSKTTTNNAVDYTVQPLTKPSTNANQLNSSATMPMSPNSGAGMPLTTDRPLDPINRSSINNLYQNRMEVETYTPATPQDQSSQSPASSMFPEMAPNRPGTIGGSGGQGKVGKP